MNAPQPAGTPRAADVRHAVDGLCGRFEEQWRQGPKPDLGAFVPPGGPLRQAALPELILLDLEYRFRGDQPAACAEDYFTRYPELRNDSEVVSRVVAAESAHRAVAFIKKHFDKAGH